MRGPGGRSVEGLACAALLVVLASACGSVAVPRTGSGAQPAAQHKAPCYPVASLPPLHATVERPNVDGQPIGLSIDGGAASDEVLDNAIAAARQRLNPNPLFQPSLPSPAPSLREAVRGSVAAVVLDHMLLCQGVADGIKPDRALAETEARAQLKAYNDSPVQAASPAVTPAFLAPSGSPQPGGRAVGLPHGTPVPGPSPHLIPGPPYAPAGRPAIPGGLTPEQYYLSEGYIDVIEAGQVRNAERRKIEHGLVGAATVKALGDWMRQHLHEYDVRVTGLGQFSLPDAYETLTALNFRR